MRIIDKIEINYFRSVYTLSLSHTNDINVFLGENDTGKSNLLKALNLFFNNETELSTSFDFVGDLSRLREKEARAAKGRASIWIKVTLNNFNNWSSLPKKFTMKRSWNRYSSVPIDTYPKDVPGTTMGRFIARINFHYIPAVRGRGIFSHYLNLLNDSLIDDERAGVRNASERLIASINDSTVDMADRIREGLGFESSIQVPDNLKELFEALDFSTGFASFTTSVRLKIE